MLPCAIPAMTRLNQVVAEYLPAASDLIDPNTMRTITPTRRTHKNKSIHDNRSRNCLRITSLTPSLLFPSGRRQPSPAASSDGLVAPYHRLSSSPRLCIIKAMAEKVKPNRIGPGPCQSHQSRVQNHCRLGEIGGQRPVLVPKETSQAR